MKKMNEYSIERTNLIKELKDITPKLSNKQIRKMLGAVSNGK